MWAHLRPRIGVPRRRPNPVPSFIRSSCQRVRPVGDSALSLFRWLLSSIAERRTGGSAQSWQRRGSGSRAGRPRAHAPTSTSDTPTHSALSTRPSVRNIAAEAAFGLADLRADAATGALSSWDRAFGHQLPPAPSRAISVDPKRLQRPEGQCEGGTSAGSQPSGYLRQGPFEELSSAHSATGRTLRRTWSKSSGASMSDSAPIAEAGSPAR